MKRKERCCRNKRQVDDYNSSSSGDEYSEERRKGEKKLSFYERKRKGKFPKRHSLGGDHPCCFIVREKDIHWRASLSENLSRIVNERYSKNHAMHQFVRVTAQSSEHDLYLTRIDDKRAKKLGMKESNLSDWYRKKNRYVTKCVPCILTSRLNMYGISQRSRQSATVVTEDDDDEQNRIKGKRDEKDNSSTEDDDDDDDASSSSSTISLLDQEETTFEEKPVVDRQRKGKATGKVLVVEKSYLFDVLRLISPIRTLQFLLLKHNVTEMYWQVRKKHNTATTATTRDIDATFATTCKKRPKISMA